MSLSVRTASQISMPAAGANMGHAEVKKKKIGKHSRLSFFDLRLRPRRGGEQEFRYVPNNLLTLLF